MTSANDKTLTKGLQVLEALSECEGSGGISELAERLSLTKSNVHRLLQTLVRSGYVAREAATGRYLLSSKLWRISHRGSPYQALQRLVRPVLRGVVDSTNESAVFVVIDNDDLVLIDQVETQNPVRVFFSIGQSFSIDQVVMSGKGLTALQMIALSTRSDDEVAAAARRVQRQLRKGDSFAELLASQIHAIRRTRFAMSRGEWVSGANAVAAPVVGPTGALIGVLSCFGPAERLPDTRLRQIQKIVAASAADLSARLCG